MVIFTKRQWRIFNRIRRKYKVSLEFLNYNMPNILKIIAYYVNRLHFVLKCSAERSFRNGSVVIRYNRLMRLLFDESYRKRIKRRKHNVKQWSKRMVLYLRKTQGVKEYVLVKKIKNFQQKAIKPEEIIRQLKEQLEILKSGKRSTQLIDCSLSESETKSGNSSREVTKSLIEDISNAPPVADDEPQIDEVILNEKTGMLENINGTQLNESDCSQNPVETVAETSEAKNSANILDLLMSKVRASSAPVQNLSNTLLSTTENDIGVDSGEEFLGFAEDENIPGLMRTPLVPSVCRSKEDNAAFVSESLDEYFRENSLNRSADIEQFVMLKSSRKLRQANIDGLMTLNCSPPAYEMPAVPESLQKLRTVAERRHFLQKFSKNFKLAIINNEAAIYRELQRKIRQPKTKISSQLAMQASSSQMSFTRQGWQAASFVTTELNKFFFQKLFLLDEKKCIVLRGVRGNNADQYKKPFTSKISFRNGYNCTRNCIDCHIARCLKPISTYANNKKLCKEPFRAIFKACPLSKKPNQPLLDDDAAEILLNGGGMTVVRLPTVELQVCPESGKPLNDIAKRYLEYIRPYEEITREWAEFSTSTLQFSSMHAKFLLTTPKFYTFTVPYVNDRSHILVRRIVDRSEKLDPYFLRSPEETSWSSFSFSANIDKCDSLQVECASVLADMINAVAISCSENSFVREDSESLYTAQDYGPILSKETNKKRKNPSDFPKTTAGSKKSRLICELRRLNATIIETNAHHKDVQKCLKEFCALGCICPSLSNGYPLQQHCGKPKCMLQCICKGSAPSQIIRIETDGRSITTEDAYNMRRQATARLARIEKEFTSTVVVTENETLLINETQYDKKRRCTKVPKRYQDYRDTNSEFGRISPVKSCSTPLIDGNESRSSPSTTVSEIMSDLQEPVYIKDVILKQLKHCSIPIVPFNEIQNMAVWCMVHQMYKCFCGGHALDGKRFLIEKDGSKVLPDSNKSNTKMKFSSKAYYSFESTEDPAPDPIQISENIKSVDSRKMTSDDCKLEKHEKLPYNTSLISELDSAFFKNYFTHREHLGCSRFVPVPSLKYRSVNRKRRGKILDDIEYIEDNKSQLLLNEHIMRSVYFHKEKTEPAKMKQEKLENVETISEKFPEETMSLDIELFESKTKTEENTEPEEEEEEEEEENRKKPELKCLEKAYASSSQASKPDTVKRNSILIEEPQPEKKKLRLTEQTEDTIVELDKKQQAIEVDKQQPKISGCYSVQSQNEPSNKITGSERNLTSGQLAMDTAAGLSTFSEGLKENYNEVIKMLNSLVSRKMHAIDNALKRDSKIVPAPSESVLCVLQWKNFLGAFHDGLIYIWEVKMKTRSFLAATVTNVIPMVLGALAVISITQSSVEQLPLIGRMILQGDYLKESLNLAVIMQGRLHYWYVKGFLQPNVANACLRPTPETHPELTKKINTLCSSLIKQRTRELERQEAVIKQKAKSCAPSSNLPPQQKQDNISKGNSEPSSLLRNSTSNQQVSKSQNQSEASKIEQNKTFGSTKLNQNQWISNIELRKLQSLDMNDVQLPEIHPSDHSWYVLDLCSDFSHIFVPVQKEILSLDRIQRLISLSIQKQKVIRIQFLKRACFDAFIVPTSKRKIYFGPFPLNVEPPLLVLLQSVDGKMMTRETYHSVHKIPRKSTETTAFWLKRINGRISFDDTSEDKSHKSQVEPTLIRNKSSTPLNTDCDDDCFIVDVPIKLPKIPQNSISPSILPSSKAAETISTQPELSHSKNSDGFIELGSQAAVYTKNYKSVSPTANRTNFIIQSSNKRNAVEIIPSNGSNELNYGVQTTKTVENNLVSQQGEQKTLPMHSPKTMLQLKANTSLQPELLHKKASSVNSCYNAQTHVTKSVTPTTTTTTIPLAKKLIKLTSAPKQQDPDRPVITSKANGELNGTVIVPNSLYAPTSNSTVHSCHPTTSTLVSAQLVKASPTAMQRGIAKGLISNSPTTSKVNITKIAYPAATNTTMTSAPSAVQKTGSKETPNNSVKNTMPRILTTEVTASSSPLPSPSQPTVSAASNVVISKSSPRPKSTVGRIASDTLKTSHNTFNTTKTTTSSTLSVESSQTSHPTVLIRTSATKSTVLYGTKPRKFVAQVKSPTKKPANIHYTPEMTSSAPSTTQQSIFHQRKSSKGNITLNSLMTEHMDSTTIINSSGKSTSSETISTNPFPVYLSTLDSNHADKNKRHSSLSSSPTISRKSIIDATHTVPVYGYFCSNLGGTPRYLSKRVQSEYYIKVPNYGIVRQNGLIRANVFLNQHLANTYSPPISEKVTWNFVPHKNNNSIQNRATTVQRGLSIQSRRAMERGKITPPNVNLELVPRLKQTSNSKPSYQRAKNISMSTSINTASETILIDD